MKKAPKDYCRGDGPNNAFQKPRITSKVSDKKALNKFVNAYKKKYDFDPSTMNEPVFIIQPKIAFGQIEKTFRKTATRWTF